MYALELLAVLAFVYTVPALAIRPGLVASPETVIAIPFISVALVVAMQAALSAIDLFAPGTVWAFSGIFAALAVVRRYRKYKKY